MPYVLRDENGCILGLFARPQEFEVEWKEEDDPEIVACRDYLENQGGIFPFCYVPPDE